MAAYVTVPGGTFGTISIGGSSSNQFVAQVIANSILLASKSGGVQFAEAVASTGGSVYVPPANLSDAVRELIIPTSVTGVVNIPTGYTDVVIAGTGPVSLVGSSNVEIASNVTSGGSYKIAGSANEALSGGNNNLNVGGTGATYIIAIGGTGTNVINATGRGVVTGSDGTNHFVVKDTADSGSKVISVGTNDVVSLGGDKVSVIASGPGASIVAAGARDYAQLHGLKESVFAGSGADSIYSGGTQDVVLGNSGTLGVYDTGTNDTIAAFGAASPSIAAWGRGADIFGGSNNIAVTLSGGPVQVGTTLYSVQGGNTFFAGSGNAHVDLGPVVVNNGGTLVTIESGTNAVIGGSGSLYVHDQGAFDTIFAANAPFASVVAGGSTAQEGGAEIFGAGAGTLVASVAGSNDTVFAGSGTSYVSIAGSGDNVFGGSGAEYVDFQGSNKNAILAGTGPTQVTTSGSDLVFGGLTSLAGGVTVNAAGGDTIVGFNAASLVVSVNGGGKGTQIYGGNNTTTVDLNSGSDAQVFGGVGTLNVSIAYVGISSQDTILGGTGVMNVIDRNQGDAIAAFGASSANVTVSARDKVFAGSNVLTASVGGGHNTLLGGSGTENITLGAAASVNAVYGSSGQLNVVDNGTTDTIAAFGASSAYVTLGGSGAAVFGGSNTTNVTDNGSNDTIFGTTGTLDVTQGGSSSGLWVLAGSGNLQFTGGTNGATIIGTSGTTTVTEGTVTLFGQAGGLVTYNGSKGSLDFSAGAGNETLNASGSSANNFIAGGSGADSLVGGSGNDTFTAGTGAATMTAGTGDNNFVFFQSVTNGNNVHDYINGWNSNDALFVVGYGESAASVIGSAKTTGSSTTLTLSDNTQITFENVSASAINKIVTG